MEILVDIFFSHLVTYLLTSVLGIVLALTALVWGHPNRLTRALLVLSLLAILAFPWFRRYEPAVVPAPGYQMRWPTRPGRLETVVKAAQAAAEIRPCEYTLLGWRADGVLYYQETCRWGTRVWGYDPVTEGGPRRLAEAPANLVQEAREVWELDGIWVPGVPPEGQAHTRSVVVQGQGLASPDGRWVAVVVRHLYGPEDVVVLSLEEENRGSWLPRQRRSRLGYNGHVSRHAGLQSVVRIGHANLHPEHQVHPLLRRLHVLGRELGT